MEQLIPPIVTLISLAAVAVTLSLVANWTTNFVVRTFLSWTGFIQDEL